MICVFAGVFVCEYYIIVGSLLHQQHRLLRREILRNKCKCFASSFWQTRTLALDGCVTRSWCSASRCSGMLHGLRFRTNADMAGTEKVAVAQIRPELKPADFPTIAVGDVTSSMDSGMLAPMSVFCVKGWSRCVCAVACMRHAYETPEAFKAGTTVWLVVHASLGPPSMIYTCICCIHI